MTTIESSHTVIIHDGGTNGQLQNVRIPAEDMRIPATMNDEPVQICLRCYDEPALPGIIYCADCLKQHQDEYADEYEASLPTCQGKENGVECSNPATIAHVTNETAWRGFPPETVYLCQGCYNRLWSLVWEIREDRIKNRIWSEKGRVA